MFWHPRISRKTLWDKFRVPYREKYFSTKIPSFSRGIFFIISNVCAARSRYFFNFQTHLLCRSKKLFHDLARKNNYTQNKFATVEKSPNENRKVTSRSEILASEINPPLHPYYFISLCRSQDNFTNHFTEPF